MTSLICKYKSNKIDAKDNTFQGFHNKGGECYCKYMKCMIIKVMTVTASNSNCYVYVK